VAAQTVGGKLLAVRHREIERFTDELKLLATALRERRAA